MKFPLIGRKTWRPTFAIALTALSVTALSVSACSDAEPPSQDDGGGAPAKSGGASGQSGGAPGEGGNGPGTGGEAQGGEPGSGGEASGGAASGGAGSGGEASGGAATFVTAKIEDLAVTSSLNYDFNDHGVISGSTLARYQADWAANRPAGVTGKLVILQILPSGSPQQVVSKTDAEGHTYEGVSSYIVPAARVAQARNDGISNFETDIPDGPTADAFLKSFDIDPTKDFIVLTFEQIDAPTATTNAVVQSVGRAWVFLNYWGLPKERLAILNGSINYNSKHSDLDISVLGSHRYDLPEEKGTKSWRDLARDQTVTSISLEEILAILDGDEGAPDKSKIRIVDARGGAEAYGLKKATSTGRLKCTSYDPGTPAGPGGVPAAIPGDPLKQRCSTPFEGRIKGAQSVPWTQFIQNAANGFRFLSPFAAKTIFDQQSGWVDGTHTSTIQYCRTNQRSTVTGLVANVILGYPTRLYETSFIEWGHLSAGPDAEDTPNKENVAGDFPFRTDLAAYTEHAVLDASDNDKYTPGGTLLPLLHPELVQWVDGPNYNDEVDINPPSAVAGDLWPKLNPAGTTTRASIEADKAYLTAD